MYINHPLLHTIMELEGAFYMGDNKKFLYNHVSQTVATLKFHYYSIVYGRRFQSLDPSPLMSMVLLSTHTDSFINQLSWLLWPDVCF